MATPQRQYPPEPERRPELTNLQQGGVERKVGPGWRFGFWWIYILIIVAIWYVGFGWGNSGGWIWGHRHAATTAVNDAEVSGPGVPILNAGNKQSFIGQAFDIRNVPVERQAGQHAVWIGSRFNSTPMLVVLPTGSVMPPPAGANPPEVPPAQGNTVTVTPNGARTGATTGATAATTGNQANNGSNHGSAAGTNTVTRSAGDNASQSGGNMNHGSATTAANTSAGLREWLDVTGRVQKAPSAAQAQQQWGLSQADASQLAQEGAYIQATQVQRAPQDR